MIKKQYLVIKQYSRYDNPYFAPIAPVASVEEALSLLPNTANEKGDGRGAEPFVVDVIIDNGTVYIPVDIENNEPITTEYMPY